MSQLFEKSKEEVIAEIVALINDKFPPAHAKQLIAFTKQFYSTVSLEELTNDSITNLYGAIVSFWNFFSIRKSDECKIRVYNPSYEQHGWQSTHTIVEVVQNDMPFLIDSLRMEINREGLSTHLMIHVGGMKVQRDHNGQIINILPFNTSLTDDIYAEAPIYIEIDRQTDPEFLANLEANLHRILGDVRAAVADWQSMRQKLKVALSELAETKLDLNPEELSETKDFLKWLDNDHFTFLGYREYIISGEGDNKALEMVSGSGLGVLRNETHAKKRRLLTSMTPEALAQANSKHPLIISKTNTRSSVHRPTYTDYIGIKRFNERGELIGEHRFIGLYTSAAYTSNPKYIPFVRRKVAIIMKSTNLSPNGHAAKALLNILETFPRDDLFQASTEELLELSTGILHLQERKRIRMFARQDIFRRFISVLVYVPRERFDTELGLAMQEVLRTSFNALEISFTTWFSESELARIHYLVRIDPTQPLNYDVNAIEQKLVSVARSWRDDLKTNLLEQFGEEQGNLLYATFANAFAAGYREVFNPITAIFDIKHLLSLNDEKILAMSFFKPMDDSFGSLRFKLFRANETIALSDALPIFENMGLRVIGERPYKLVDKDKSEYWINDFSLVYSKEMAFEIEHIKDIFEEAFFRIWRGDAENDGFNRLVLAAGLNYREITILRAYVKYLRQIEFVYSQVYIEACLVKYPVIALLLVQLFILKFDPAQLNSAEAITNVEAKIRREMDSIKVLDEDRIIRKIHEVINATLRTNYFQKNQAVNPKSYLSIKLEPRLITDMPLPLPMYEIFVYSPQFEGVHLRTSKVARGGLRWSDRREDFRTEILGLMKAQNVKNSIIVPSGAKGGFYPKLIPADATRDQIMQEGINCYKNFIRGLLDLTDNLVGTEIVKPDNVVEYDDIDTYLVVAADKGTATFSDIANEISKEYNFWLSDAFASGGSSGYDHKKIGITARGAWESVKRHFRELNIDTQQQKFTVIGIGDMSGDVFGNGMLLSPHIQLIAAFDHRHIFIDPNPDSEASFDERLRLFNLPRSSWEDYEVSKISKGGGVYARNVKAIQLSPEIRELFAIKTETIVPNELIKLILKAKVDLIWNGGIGTFVKSSKEINANVGDKTNDGIRVNGNELQAKVVGEGGNLGFTQLSRIEYELSGGLIYTDFIDNSAGVDCSDHEVNLKIVLNDMIANGDLTLKQRDHMLVNMTNDVANLVLHNNYRQTQAVDLASFTARENIDLHARYIKDLSDEGLINREIEFLPDQLEIANRKANNKGLTRPEIAVLFAYTKNLIKREILNSEIPDETYVKQVVDYAFPNYMREHYESYLQTHRLKREIIATLVANALINEAGFTFVYQLKEETGLSSVDILRAYGVVRNVFQVNQIQREIEALDYKIATSVQLEMFNALSRLIRRTARWLLRNYRTKVKINELYEAFGPGIEKLQQSMQNILVGSGLEKYNELFTKYKDLGVPENLAKIIASERAMTAGLDIVDLAHHHQFDIEEVAYTYFSVSDRLDIYWFKEQLNNYNVANEWEEISREICRDDLDGLLKEIVLAILTLDKPNLTKDEKIEFWLTTHQQALNRWQELLTSLRISIDSFSVFGVAVRELMDASLALNAKKLTKAKSKQKQV